MKLLGKTAVVVGASGGIGSEISLALAEKGVNLVLVARKREALLTLKEKIGELGSEAEVLTCDLTDTKSIDSLTEMIKEKHKSIDLLFHVSGIGVYKKLEEISLEEWQTSMDVNVNSVFYLTQKLIPLLRKSKKAYVLAMGSGMGKIGLSGRSPYCASKFALRGLMLSLAKEFKKTNVNFVLLTLGSVLTGFGPLSLDKKKQKEEKGKGYIDPHWLGKHIAIRLENETLDEEVP
ncbi:SDR family oxidoreductase, partial [Patescibacteria group bacterium]|nr:SDR family oxidoreductase [Patescibacteria group bacterium]